MIVNGIVLCLHVSTFHELLWIGNKGKLYLAEQLYQQELSGRLTAHKGIVDNLYIYSQLSKDFTRSRTSHLKCLSVQKISKKYDYMVSTLYFPMLFPFFDIDSLRCNLTKVCCMYHFFFLNAMLWFLHSLVTQRGDRCTDTGCADTQLSQL